MLTTLFVKKIETALLAIAVILVVPMVGAYGSLFAQTCVQSSTSWQNVPLTSQTGPFTMGFTVTPNNANMDGVLGLSMGSVGNYSDLAAVARFEPSGIIEFSSAYGYYTETGIAYIPQVSYYFRFVVDPTAHTYSVFVTPAGGAEVLVANNYSFQLQQGGISSIANAAIIDICGFMSVCGFF